MPVAFDNIDLAWTSQNNSISSHLLSNNQLYSRFNFNNPFLLVPSFIGLFASNAELLTCFNKRGIIIWSVGFHNIVSICVSFNLIVANESIHILDFYTGNVIKTVESKQVSKLVRSNKLILCAQADGDLIIRDGALKIIKVVHAHSSSIIDMDCSLASIATIGYTNLGSGIVIENQIKIWNIKNFNLMYTIQLDFTPSFIKFHPSSNDFLFVTSSYGQVQQCNLLDPQESFQHQLEIESYISSFDVCQTAHVLVFSDQNDELYYWVLQDPPIYNYEVIEPEMPTDPGTLRGILFDGVPLSSIPLPISQYQLLSDFDYKRSEKQHPKIPDYILANVKMSGNVGFAYI